MKNLILALISFYLAGIGYALPPAAFVHIEKIEGTVIEIPKFDKGNLVAVRMSVTSSSDPEKVKTLYSTIRKKTRYPIQDLKRPGKDEVILILPWGQSLPKGAKVGDKLRVLGYAIRGSDVSLSPRYTSAEFRSIKLNPKG
jgi:hypothetical protein